MGDLVTLHRCPVCQDAEREFDALTEALGKAAQAAFGATRAKEILECLVLVYVSKRAPNDCRHWNMHVVHEESGAEDAVEEAWRMLGVILANRKKR